jgi:NAD(P)H-dependent FMN reductase
MSAFPGKTGGELRRGEVLDHQAHTRAWADKIASFDGFVMITPEYNHSTSGVLKNALHYLYAEWNNKAAGFVSYGGARAAEQLRLICGALQMADVSQQVTLSLGHRCRGWWLDDVSGTLAISDRQRPLPS